MKLVYLTILIVFLSLVSQPKAVTDKLHNAGMGMNSKDYVAHTRMNSKNHAPAFINVYSNELIHQTGGINVLASLHAEDTAYFHADSFSFLDTSVFSLSISGLSGAYTLYPGDSIVFTIEGTYNTSALPYSYTNNSLIVKLLNTDSTESLARASFKVYFTPYGTTEIWNSFDFDELPRTWEVFDSIVPQRIYIDPLTIPVSDRNTPTDSSDDWEYEFQLKRIEGLPYAIQMTAAHPDSLAIYVHRDSTNGHDTSLVQKGVFVDSYTGVVSGRLSIRMLNDLST